MSTKPQKLGLFTAKLTKRAKKDKIKALINPERRSTPQLLRVVLFMRSP